MKLFIRRIPEATTRKDLKKFIEEGLSRGFHWPFSAKPTLHSYKIIKIRVRDTNEVEYHGLATIGPDKLGPAVIKHLHGRKLNGRAVLVRADVDAVAARARRADDVRGGSTDERARIDRRRAGP